MWTSFQKRRRAIVSGLLMSLLPVAHAGFFQWETVELPASSGAACGDGSPYRFFVNRNPFTQKTVLMFEGGGGCWDQAACEGKVPLGASNPNGVSGNYLQQLNTAALGLITPFTSRLDPFQRVRTQAWNIVYIPYCTGDVHTGNVVKLYDDADATHPRTQYHRGLPNIQGMAKWIRSQIGRPSQLFVTGFSAGGVGATSDYVVVRDILEPTGPAALLADSGPLFRAPRSASPQQYPSVPLQNTIRAAWGADLPNGIINSFKSALPAFDRDDLGSIYGALSKRFPQDSFGYTLFKQDQVFPAFSYAKFDPAIASATDVDVAKTLMNQHWLQDIKQWLPDLDRYPNISYQIPFMRDFAKSHCLTVVDWSGTGVDGSPYASIEPLVNGLLDGDERKRSVDQNNVAGETSLSLKLFSFLMSFVS